MYRRLFPGDSGVVESVRASLNLHPLGRHRFPDVLVESCGQRFQLVSYLTFGTQQRRHRTSLVTLFANERPLQSTVEVDEVWVRVSATIDRQTLLHRSRRSPGPRGIILCVRFHGYLGVPPGLDAVVYPQPRVSQTSASEPRVLLYL